ncbi:hypothetical protein G5V59_02720 [Nocardioides sp. W3-2-3]|nr:hypothetical protein [Nocardioides convexus]
MKADALAKATFPVDGLGFDDDGVTYQGVPFAQASSAEQIRVSLAMAMSLNPQSAGHPDPRRVAARRGVDGPDLRDGGRPGLPGVGGAGR